MVFSKSLGYAIYAILYVAKKDDAVEHIQLDEIARVLRVPRYFVAKVMNKLVKGGVLDSVKGHYGGFCANKNTLSFSIADICDITGDKREINLCVFQLQSCSDSNPCPFHHLISSMRIEWHTLIINTTLGELLANVHENLLNRLAGELK